MSSLSEIVPAFIEMAHAIVSASVATVDPRIWQATSGYLQAGLCAEGGLALRTVTNAVTKVGDSVLFQPQPGAHNAASGDLLIGVGAKIQ